MLRADGVSTGLGCLVAFALVLMVEYHAVDHTGSSITGSGSDESGHASLSHRLVQKENQLVVKEEELIKALQQVNERDLKINYLTRNLRQVEGLMQAYRLVLHHHKEEDEVTAARRAASVARIHAMINDTVRHVGIESDEDSVKVEKVVRVSRSESDAGGVTGGDSSASEEADAGDLLVDAERNQYILSAPTDSSRQQIDTRLLRDLAAVIAAAALGGVVASALKQPILLGYLLGGSVVGPGGLKIIQQFVQVETLAQFGATFLLFALGVEFSYPKLKEVRFVAVVGGSLEIVALMGVTSLAAPFFGVSAGGGAFIGAVLAMSSTTVAVKSLISTRQTNTQHGQIMLALLICQDCALGIFLSLLPLVQSESGDFVWTMTMLLGRLAFLVAVIAVCMTLWPKLLGVLENAHSHDLFLLGIVAMCVMMTTLTEYLLNSAEVGAFLAGVLISSSPAASAEMTHKTLAIFEPVRDMFGALFFSSIGMLINPSFLMHNAYQIALVVVVVVMVKFVFTAAMVRLCGYSFYTAVSAGLGMAQIGEFAFVLANDGLKSNLISKDTYLVLLGATAVTLFTTPFVFKLAPSVNALITRAGCSTHIIPLRSATSTSDPLSDTALPERASTPDGNTVSYPSTPLHRQRDVLRVVRVGPTEP